MHQYLSKLGFTTHKGWKIIFPRAIPAFHVKQKLTVIEDGS